MFTYRHDEKVMYDVDMRWNWDSVVGVATKLVDGLYGVRISAVLRDFYFLQKSRPLSLLLSGYRSSFTRVRRTGIKVVHTPPSSDEVNTEWSYTFTLPMDSNNFSFIFIDIGNKYFTMFEYTHFMYFM